MICTGQQLVNRLRHTADKVSSRLWIATPYLGELQAIRRILGRRWIDDKNVSVRLLVDTNNNGWISPESYSRMRARGDVKNLLGLHAKVYIIDDNVLVSSANLTSTAFSKRFEMGVLLTGSSARQVISIYEEWWNSEAEDIPLGWSPQRGRKAKKRPEEPGQAHFKNHWDLPGDPGDTDSFNKTQVAHFLDYEDFLRHYKDLASRYSRIQRIGKNSPLYLEIDGFLSFLYHHGKRPSKPFLRKDPAVLSETEKNRRIRHYARLFKKEVVNGDIELDWRTDCARFIQQTLGPRRIHRITKTEIEDVVDCINAMNTGQFAKYNREQFLRVNSKDTIRAAWNRLLHGSGTIAAKMTWCSGSLRHFGKSCAQELLGYYYPRQFPLRNQNVNAGLRFLGYPVKSY